jgi:hypothetical protein
VTAQRVRVGIIAAINTWRAREKLNTVQAASLLGCHKTTLRGGSLYTLALERLIEILERTGQRFDFTITPVEKPRSHEEYP